MHSYGRDFWRDFEAVGWTELPGVFQVAVPDQENGLVLVGKEYIVFICQGFESEPPCDLEVYILRKDILESVSLEEFEQCAFDAQEAKDDYETFRKILKGDRAELEHFAEIFFNYYRALERAVLNFVQYCEVEDC